MLNTVKCNRMFLTDDLSSVLAAAYEVSYWNTHTGDKKTDLELMLGKEWISGIEAVEGLRNLLNEAIEEYHKADEADNAKKEESEVQEQAGRADS